MNELSSAPQKTLWAAKHVYVMSALCLMTGLAVGYLFRGSASPAPQAATAPATQSANPHATQGMPSLEQMKQMADKQAEPFLAKIKADPKDSKSLIELARIYQLTHQFSDAKAYYQKALEVDPGNVAGRTALASCMYYSGDADGAIEQLHEALARDPENADSLFNLGVILWQARKDSKGALASWHKLLKSNPALGKQKKAQVEQLIADASRTKTNSSSQ